jgi:hypothetical protein
VTVTVPPVKVEGGEVIVEAGGGVEPAKLLAEWPLVSFGNVELAEAASD